MTEPEFRVVWDFSNKQEAALHRMQTVVTRPSHIGGKLFGRYQAWQGNCIPASAAFSPLIANVTPLPTPVLVPSVIRSQIHGNRPQWGLAGIVRVYVRCDLRAAGGVGRSEHAASDAVQVAVVSGRVGVDGAACAGGDVAQVNTAK
jgi:hypothetical protein